MAATGRGPSPQRHEGPIPARTRGKAKRPHQVRLRRHPPSAVGGSRGTPTRRPPRGRPVWRILDQLPQTQPTTRKAVPATTRPTASPPRSRRPPALNPLLALAYPMVTRRAFGVCFRTVARRAERLHDRSIQSRGLCMSGETEEAKGQMCYIDVHGISGGTRSTATRIRGRAPGRCRRSRGDHGPRPPGGPARSDCSHESGGPCHSRPGPSGAFSP